MCFPSGGGANKLAKEQRADEVARQNRIKSGMGRIDEIFGGFNQDFYDGRAKAYEAYAMPQVDRAYGRTKDDLVYALARSGLLDSSAGQAKNAELGEEFDQNRVDVANRGLETANRARSDVENVRSGLVSQLNATGDDQAAAQGAIRQAQNLNEPQGFSPLGQLFASFAGSLSNIGSNSRNGYSGFFGRGPSFSTAGGTGSARVVG